MTETSLFFFSKIKIETRIKNRRGGGLKIKESLILKSTQTRISTKKNLKTFLNNFPIFCVIGVAGEFTRKILAQKRS